MKADDYRCKTHQEVYKENYIVSPGRAKCKHCKKTRVVAGYSNPDHLPNPFGYLFLFPVICDDCALSLHQCKWCRGAGSSK